MTRLILGDALAEARKMESESIDLIVTDPPYYRVKALDWDRQWDTPEQYLNWLGENLEQWQRLLKKNGSLYVFASPQMAARVECKIGERFDVLNSITWAKPAFSTKAEMFRKDWMRAYFPSSERIIFAEQQGSDGYALKCDGLRGFLFEPLRAYLDNERKRAGVSFEQVRQIVGCADGSGLPSHWFTQSQWMLPTAANYKKLKQGFNADCNGSGPQYLRREYEDLRREYEDLRREYEDLRRPFSVTADVPYTDVWTFPTVAAYPGKHPCEKPLAMIEHIIKASSREGAVVADFFMGSGVTGIAANNLGREFIGVEISEHWYSEAGQRIEAQQETLPLFDAS